MSKIFVVVESGDIETNTMLFTNEKRAYECAIARIINWSLRHYNDNDFSDVKLLIAAGKNKEALCKYYTHVVEGHSETRVELFEEEVITDNDPLPGFFSY